MELLKTLNKKVLIFDGAMGTMLQKEGLVGGELPELYNIEKPDVLKKIHKEYVDAGADIITTNTFGANSLKISNTPYTVDEIIAAAVENIRAVITNQLIALDIGPTGKLLEPIGSLSFEEAYELFKEQVIAGVKSGVDLILIETFSDLQETRAAILACKENSNLPVFCTMTFQDNGRTLTGTDATTFVNVVQDLGIDALGVNCSLGPKELAPIIEEILNCSLIPVIVQPNAGLPTLENNETVFELEKEEFTEFIKPSITKGVAIVGGCCGTTPDFTKLLKTSFGGKPVVKRNVKRKTAVCSSTQTVIIDGRVKIIGERINPTGKKKIKEALKLNKMDFILNEAMTQVDAGADILDINVGLPEIDEKDAMVSVIKELAGIVKVPLQIDSAKTDVIEAACRLYCGKTIINSVNGKQINMDKIFPIARKYGASLIALTLDEDGIPATCEKRFEIAEKIIKEAKKYGIDEERLFIDNLVLTASAQQEGVLETLKGIKKVKDNYNVRTTLGASNVSFGLPNRHMLNKTFLVMAMTYGLDVPITDPTAPEIVGHIKAFEVLSSIDIDSKNYINYMDSTDLSNLIEEKNTSESNKDLQTIIIKGLKDEVEAVTALMLKDSDPMVIVDEYLIPALNIVGQAFNDGDIYLPQLIRSAETVKKSFVIIKEQLLKSGMPTISNGKVLLATVKGDIHDIGKNIVKVILENYGFEVFDLGKDVQPEEIVETVIKENIKLVGLSALMTTTVISMEETIKQLREANLDCIIVVGGAVLTPDYAKKIDADYYCKDARETVEVANKVFNIK
ncbi:MAG: homocysteine S-methyltransferase family protein [Peptostreptococcaceae bacterium]|nr:homocysteine S-methyltransferase family protein [Peptostreptococcaceae bacterium]